MEKQAVPELHKAPDDVPPIRIEHTTSWRSLRLGEVWSYRELLWFLTMRDIRGRYRQMALGPLWIVIKPLIDMVIFSLIFGGLAKLPSENIPYPVFTYTALLPWTYFSNVTSGSAGSLRSRMGLISKVYFPRLIAPLTAVISSLVDFGISFLVLLIMVLAYGLRPTRAAFAIPLYLLLAAATGLGIGLWVAGLSVRFRDLAYGINYGLQVWMWATPVAYSASLIPERFSLIYRLNPMYWVIEGFRLALLGTGQPLTTLSLIPISVVVVLLFSGAFIFRRAELSIVDWK